MNPHPIDLEHRAVELLPPMGRLPRRWDRGLQILRHYSWVQLARRGWRNLVERARPSRVIPLSANSEPPRRRPHREVLSDLASIFAEWRMAADHKPTIDFSSGKVTLLNESRELGWPICWDDPALSSAPHLWLFQWQYHEFLLAFGPSPPPPVREKIWQMIAAWIGRFTPQRVRAADDAWHPYCIARRVPAWIWLLHIAGPTDREEHVLQSLAQQTDYLAAHLERDPGGNHLLENLFAIGLAGCYFDDGRSERWLSLAERQLARELPQQILSHGEHFERSPMYHCQVLTNLLTLAAASACRPALQALCRAHAAPMAAFIVELLHPDQEIPLFGDSVFDEVPSTGYLRRLAEFAGVPWPNATRRKPIGPYWIYHHDRSALIWDTGPVGAPGLPAHAHADLLSLEASIDGNRWIVDGGVFDYAASSMRRYCRSSVAHNVVIVNGRDTCDTWSMFRMGRRGEATGFVWGETPPMHWGAAQHNAFQGCGVPVMERVVACWPEGFACADRAPSSTRLALEGYLHLAPELVVDRLGPNQFRVTRGNSVRVIEFFGVDEVSVAQGWYCPQFGQRIRNVGLVYRQTRGDNRLIGWSLTRSGVACTLRVRDRLWTIQVGDQIREWSTP